MGKNGDPGESEDAIKELLLKDYEYFSDLFSKNEESGETRVNLFIGIVTLVATALGVLISSEKAPIDMIGLRFIVMASLFGLLVLGVITMFRLLLRNQNTDIYKQGLDTIRQVYLDTFDGECRLVGYHPFTIPIKGDDTAPDEERGWQTCGKEPKPRGFGGLAHMVAAINSLLAAGCVGTALYPVPIENSTLWYLVFVVVACGLAFGLSFSLQVGHIDQQDIEAKKKVRAGIPTHAGGVVYTLKDHSPQYLLVRPRDKPGQEWVLPKGRIEEGEWHGEAALREVSEETGIVARLLCPVGSFRFAVNGKKCHVTFYLMECAFRCDLGRKGEQIREQGWFPPQEAVNLLTYAESRCILKKAEELRLRRAHDQKNAEPVQE